MSPAQLVWTQQQHTAREIKAEIRWLLSATAAANTGANGGDAAKDRLELLQDELKTLCNQVADAEPKSNTPLSAEEFAEWVNRKS